MAFVVLFNCLLAAAYLSRSFVADSILSSLLFIALCKFHTLGSGLLLVAVTVGGGGVMTG